MKRTLLDIHIYLSLVCVPYLVFYGLSTLSMVHDWAWMSPRIETVEWEQATDITSGALDVAAAEAVRDELGLFGWVPDWEIRRAGDAEMSFLVARPAKQYRVRWDRDTGRVRVSETRRGFWGAVRGLHGLVSLPQWRLSGAWTLYTELSVIALLFAVAGGVYFWWLRLESRRAGALLLALGSGGALLFMMYIVR